MKEITLTRGLVSYVDDDDFERINQFRWWAIPTKSTVYATRVSTFDKKRTTIQLHNFIMSTPKGMIVDHIDGNGLNNIKSNLRLCLPNENRYNSRKLTTGFSKYKGVTCNWKCKYKKYRATIHINKCKLSLGSYFTEEEAAIAYNNAALLYYGEFAKLNIIGG